MEIKAYGVQEVFVKGSLPIEVFEEDVFCVGWEPQISCIVPFHWKSSLQGKGLAHFTGYNHVGHHYMACGVVHNDHRLEQIGTIIITLMVNLKHSITS